VLCALDVYLHEGRLGVRRSEGVERGRLDDDGRPLPGQNGWLTVINPEEQRCPADTVRNCDPHDVTIEAVVGGDDPGDRFSILGRGSKT